jgi:hypothetical protein
VNHKRVERLWRQERLKVPQKQPKRRRLWLNDGSCVRLRPAHQDHVWSYDFKTPQRIAITPSGAAARGSGLGYVAEAEFVARVAPGPVEGH